MNIVELIDHKIEMDGGNAFRRNLKACMLGLSDAFEERTSSGRAHLGASQIGEDCIRRLWLTFRVSGSNIYDGRMHRLFNRGHLEEARFNAMLLTAGCKIWTHTDSGEQFRFTDMNGMFAGSIDAVIRGIPEMPNEPVLGEYKTHSDKSFNYLKNKGLLSAQPKHYVQMQLYMHYFNLRYGLYLAVNKNDDSLYHEIVPYQRESALYYRDRAEKIILTNTMPAQINPSPGWFQCRFCSVKEGCKGDKKYRITTKSCRYCAYGQTTKAGWECHKSFAPVILDNLEPCGSWKLLPCLKGMFHV